jgi:hypothetical protein
MEPLVRQKMQQVQRWMAANDTSQVCLVVLKSLNDCAVAYKYEKTSATLEPFYIENAQASACSMMERAMLQADVSDVGDVHFRMNVTDRLVSLSIDQNGRPVLICPTSSGWSRMDIMYVNVNKTGMSTISVYGSTIPDGTSWMESFEVALPAF